jgi:SAM-dependent methyltransferase
VTPTAADPWLSYWENLPEDGLLFPPEAEEFVRNLRSAIPFQPTTRVLDFGCGFGHVAALLAPSVGPVAVWDAAASMRTHAAATLKPFQNAGVWDESSGPFDLILVNSVVQYMSADELAGRLRQWAGVLAPSGRVVLSDLTEPGHPTASDMWSLFRFSVRRGYLLRAVRNTLAERRRYNLTARERPLYRPTRSELLEHAAAAGLSVSYLSHNLTHFRGRATAVLTRTTQ